MTDIALHIFILLFFAAFFAGFVDSIAGGGGLITIPALLIAGVPPLHALGTNKLQGQFAALSSTVAYARKGHMDIRAQLPMAAIAFAGGAIGAVTAAYVPGSVLQMIMPFLLVAVAIYFAVKPNLSDVDGHRRLAPLVFGLTVVPLVGFYDGLFGPGTGSFYMLGFVTLAGYGMLKATAHTKLLNLGSNIGAFVVFIFSGAILWKLGIVMAVGSVLGAQAGSRLAMRNGARIIKPLLIVTCIAMAGKLLADPANPVRLWLGV